MANNGSGHQIAKAEAEGFAAKIGTMLDLKADNIRAVLPRGMEYERVKNVVVRQVLRTPDLLECHPGTIVSAVIDGCELGFDFNPQLGEAYLVGYFLKARGFKVCQLIPGYRGLLRLCYQSAQVKAIDAQLVYPCDGWRLTRNPEPRMEHTPDYECAEREAQTPRLVYAYAEMLSGGTVLEVMSLADVKKIQARSKAKSGPWQDDFGQMMCKTALRRIQKKLPKALNDGRLVKALEIDDRQYEAAEIDGDEQGPAAPKSDRLADELKGRRGGRVPEPVVVGADDTIEPYETPPVDPNEAGSGG